MAVRFDASGEYLRRTSSAPGIVYSLCLFVRLQTDRNTYSVFASIYSGFDDDMQSLNTGSNGTTMTIYRAEGGTDHTANLIAMTVGEWYFFAMTGNTTTTGSGYYAAVGSNTLSGPANTTTSAWEAPTTLSFGEDAHGPSERGEGDVCGIKVWDGVALSAAELQQEMFSLSPRRTENLWAWYPCIDSTVANCAKDYSGNGRDLTVNGSPSVVDNPPIPYGYTKKNNIYVPSAGGGGGGGTTPDWPIFTGQRFWGPRFS